MKQVLIPFGIANIALSKCDACGCAVLDDIAHLAFHLNLSADIAFGTCKLCGDVTRIAVMEEAYVRWTCGHYVHYVDGEWGVRK